MLRAAPTRRVALFLVAIAVALRGALAAAQLAPAGTAADARRTGMIAGQVVDAAGAPVPDAIVHFAHWGVPETPASPGGRVVADDRGRFVFGDLPPGSYAV